MFYKLVTLVSIYMKTYFSILVFSILICFYVFAQNRQKIDSLNHVLKNAGHDTIAVNALIQLGEQWLNSNPDTSIQIFRNTLNRFSLNRKNEPVFNQMKAKIFLKTGVAFKNKGLYDTAIKKKKKSRIAGCYMNIGKLHETQKNYAQAIDYLKKSLTLYESLADKKNTAYCLNNIGSILSNQKQYKEALTFFNKALQLFEEIGDKKAISTCLVNIGSTLVNCKKQNESFAYFQKAFAISDEIGDNNSKAFSLINMGAYYKLKNEYSKGIEYCSKGLEVAKSINNIELQNNAMEVLFELYSKQGDFKEAFDCHVRYKRINDSIYNAEKTKRITEVEAKYQNEKKQLVIKNQASELARKNEQMQKQRIAIIAAIAVIVLVLVFSAILYRLFRQKKLANTLLARKNNEIQNLLETVSNRNKIIEKQKTEIDDSIRYAQRIQQAILPKQETISEALEEYFILFKPKDVVSGDFYFVSKINKWLIASVADCTGHGVPGGFMSMLGLSFLNEIVNKSYITETKQVLNEMREYIIRSLHQQGVSSEQNISTSLNVKDGMDITIVAIDTETNKMTFSGANNPLYLTRKDCTIIQEQGLQIKIYKNPENLTLIEFFPNKMPVAIYDEMSSFSMHEFTLQKGDSLYLFSDGYKDQFGGPKRKKFLSKQFRELIMSIYEKPMNEQKEILDKTIEDWKGDNDQIDDITVMGIRF
ncbi:MAG: tetratricopeptide repeat protein [Bacteroidia bacterium]|nr:tetratricopeptide repeat protein [Bacteroidia bacterium]